MRTAILALIAVAAATCPVPARADCVHEASAYQGVNPDILRAIGWHESRLRPGALARNRNGSLDIGAFQINSIHLGRLAHFGIHAQALQDGCVSAYVAAWHYRQQIDRYGNSWQAVGAYHSHTPARAAWYANAIAAVLMRWGRVPQGPLPYDRALTLAASRRPPAATRHSARGPEADTSPVTVLDFSGQSQSAAAVPASPPPDSTPP